MSSKRLKIKDTLKSNFTLLFYKSYNLLIHNNVSTLPHADKERRNTKSSLSAAKKLNRGVEGTGGTPKKMDS